jgi:hypothetical protein
MILDVKGLKYPEEMTIHLMADRNALSEDDPWYDFAVMPKHLLVLGDAKWPADVKSRIVEAYKLVGLESPLRQKVVEPLAIAFGGRKHEGEYRLDYVNWEKLVDYYTFEAASISRNIERAQKLQDEAKAKYGHIFNHYNVYDAY